MPGFLKKAGFVDSVPEVFNDIYSYAWFVGLFIAGAIYTLMMLGKRELSE